MASKTVLHPLCLFTITDHYLRSAGTGAGVGAGAKTATSSLAATTGILFGVQAGQKVEIFTSFEAKVDVAADGSLKVDTAFVDDKIKLLTCRSEDGGPGTEVFPGYELLGWYSCADAQSEGDAILPLLHDLHAQFSHWNESPLFLQVFPHRISHGIKELPVTLSTAEHRGANPVFVEVSYSMEATETERCAIDYLSSTSAMQGGGAVDVHHHHHHAAPPPSAVIDSPLIADLSSTAAALRVLHERLDVLKDYVAACDSGKIPLSGGEGAKAAAGADGEASSAAAPTPRVLLREISALLSRLPVSDAGGSVEESLKREAADALLFAATASVASGAGGLAALVNKLVTIASARESEQQGGGGGGRYGPASHMHGGGGKGGDWSGDGMHGGGGGMGGRSRKGHGGGRTGHRDREHGP